jgi:hypothetical protein
MLHRARRLTRIPFRATSTLCRLALVSLSALEQLVDACAASSGGGAGGAPATDTTILTLFEEYAINSFMLGMQYRCATLRPVSSTAPPGTNTITSAADGEARVRVAAVRLCGKFVAGQDVLFDQVRLEAFLVRLTDLLARFAAPLHGGPGAAGGGPGVGGIGPGAAPTGPGTATAATSSTVGQAGVLPRQAVFSALGTTLEALVRIMVV